MDVHVYFIISLLSMTISQVLLPAAWKVSYCVSVRTVPLRLAVLLVKCVELYG